MIRAIFIGIQEGLPHRGIPDLELYNLVDDLPGHPANSTVSRNTIEQHGVLVRVSKS